MTPQQIAREAAEALYKELSEADPIKENERIAALILTAAAKMVRESGAVEALEQARDGHVSRRLTAIAALNQLRAIGEKENP